jgi:hypothetical protein
MTCGDIPVIDNACATCSDTECCDDGEACGADAECLALAKCVATCAQDDETCYEACYTAHPDGAALFSIVGVCGAHKCTTECQVPEEYSCGIAFRDAECDTCAQQACCDEELDAAYSIDHWDLMACFDACPTADDDCHVACQTSHPEGAAKARVLSNCALIECNDDCSTALGVTPGTNTCGALVFGPGTTDCTPCLETNCCDAHKTASSSEDQWLWRVCLAACAENDDECIADCEAAHPEGRATWMVMRTCGARNCSTECKEIWPNVHPCGLGWNPNLPTCVSCEETACCEKLEEIGESIAFFARLHCAGGCDEGDDACKLACDRSYPDGLALMRWGESCIISSCAAECGIEPAAVCGNHLFPDPTEACPVCRESNCCDEEKACWDDRECIQFNTCDWLCRGEQTCKDACATTFSDGAATAETVFTCLAANCETECAGCATSFSHADCPWASNP